MTSHHAVFLINAVRVQVFSVDFRGETAQLVVLLNLSRQLVEDFTGQLYSVVIVFLELHKLDQIPDGLVALEIPHLHIIVIEFVHGTPVISIANSNHDNAQWQLSAFYQQVFHLFLVVNHSVSQNEQNHVLLLLLLHCLAHLHGLSEEGSKESGP